MLPEKPTRLTLQTEQEALRATAAAFFWVLALWPCCFFSLAAFSCAFCCDWIFWCPRAIAGKRLKTLQSSEGQKRPQRLYDVERWRFETQKSVRFDNTTVKEDKE